MDPPRLSYLPALDGLRAVAVTLVVAYHLEFEWARGGFLGVDLFFVISGFLITTLLIQERDSTGGIGLASFWTRRFRRLVPPLVVMAAATVAATRLYGLPEQWDSIRWDAAAALGYVANWRFVLADQSYFESLLGPSPLRHTWSLAVEEQWYLVWPVAVAVLLALAARGKRWIPLAAIGAATVASATMMILRYDPVDPTRVYFGTDTRAQQLLVGAGLAWLMARHRWAAPAPHRRLVGALVMGAFVAFLAIAMTTSDEAPWLYHGGFLSISLLAAALVWAVSTPGRAGPLGWLGSPSLVWLGTRSYAVYLWHWPVILFVGAPMGIELSGLPLATLQVAVTLGLAELSFRLVERPVRLSAWRPTVMIGGWTAVSAVTVVVAALVLVTPEDRALNADGVVTPDLTTSTTTTLPQGAAREAAPGAPRAGSEPASSTTTPTTVAPPPTALVLGDSTALKVIDDIDTSVERSWNILGYATVGCTHADSTPIDVGVDFGTIQDERCTEWRSEWTRWKDYVQPDVSVVMIGAWEVLDHLVDDRRISFPDPAWYDVVRAAISDALDVAGAGGTPVAAIALPCMRQDASAAVPAMARNDPARVAAFNDILVEVAASKPDVHVLDLPSLLCPDGVFLEEIDGEPARYDGVHVGPAGARAVLNWLADQLDAEFRTGGT